MPARRKQRSRRQSIDEDAARFLVRLQSDIPEDERREILDWIEASPRHAVAFARARAAWRQGGEFKALEIPERFPAASTGAGEASREELAGKKPGSPSDG